jgi:hypothetical protein
VAGPPYGNPARDVEQLAVLAVRTWLGDRGEVTDTSVGHDIDFRIEYRDGRLGIGEVGWHADAEIEAMWGNTFRQERQQVVELPAGSGTWSLGLQRGANIKKLYAKLPSLIALLRAAGLRRLEVVGPFPRTAAGDEARRLGIGYITEHDATGEPLCIYFMPSGGGSFLGDANVIVDWAEGVLDSKEYADTTAKLLRLNADERHVFLMTGSATSFEAEAALQRLGRTLPTRDPRLPMGISHLWTVARFGSTHAVVWVRGEGWASSPLPLRHDHELGAGEQID